MRGIGIKDRVRRAAAGIARDRRGIAALWLAATSPILIPLLAMSVDYADWSAAKVRMQTAADAAALAGMLSYKANTDAPGAATQAAKVAQLNGATGSASPVWDAASKTLTSGDTVAQIVPGVRDSTSTSVKVTITKPVPRTVSASFASGNMNIVGTGYAELFITTAPGSGPQPCIVALASNGSISSNGNTTVNMPNCAMVSNNTVNIGGTGTVTTAGIYAKSTISIASGVSTSARFPNAPGITDPYAGYAPLQAAFAAAAAASTPTDVTCGNSGCSSPLPNGSSCNNARTWSCTIKPGTYGSLSFTNGAKTVTFQPGLHIIKGNLSFSGTTTAAGNGATLILTGAFSGANTLVFNMSAPTEAQVAANGGVAGIVMASQSSSTSSLQGSTTFQFTGAAYFPNATFDGSGASGLGSSTNQCMYLLAGSLVLAGNSYFNSACWGVGTLSFTAVSPQTSYSAKLSK